MYVANNCILYWKDNKELTVCPTCGISRWKVDNKTHKVYENIPAKAWRTIDEKFPKIAKDSRNLRLGISADGVDVNSGTRHHSGKGKRTNNKTSDVPRRYERQRWEDLKAEEKNVCDSLVGTLLNVPGKTKDGMNARLDVAELGIKPELLARQEEDKTKLPPAVYITAAFVSLTAQKRRLSSYYCCAAELLLSSTKLMLLVQELQLLIIVTTAGWINIEDWVKIKTLLFNIDWSAKSQTKHHRKSVSVDDGSYSNTDNSRLMEKLEALTIKMDSQIISLNEELEDMREKYNELRNGNASKNNMNDDTPMCERHEVNYIQSEEYQNQISHNSFSRQSHYDPNDSEKSLTELNKDVRNDLKDFKICVHSMRTVHWKLFARDDDWTEPQPLPQAHTEQVNVVFTRSGKSDDSLKTQKDPPPPIIVDNKTKKDKPIKTTTKRLSCGKTKRISIP
ncbi:hypothetical protein Tco_0126588 [Tanacetum coccineum]